MLPRVRPLIFGLGNNWASPAFTACGIPFNFRQSCAITPEGTVTKLLDDVCLLMRSPYNTVDFGTLGTPTLDRHKRPQLATTLVGSAKIYGTSRWQGDGMRNFLTPEQ